MKEMKYEEPRLEVLCFEAQDIITTSPGQESNEELITPDQEIG